MSLKTRMIAASLMIAGALGVGSAGDMREAAPMPGYEPRPPSGRHRYRGTPYSARPEDKAERFRKCKRGCRPPARRHYGPRRQPPNFPKRLRDQRAWFKRWR